MGQRQVEPEQATEANNSTELNITFLRIPTGQRQLTSWRFFTTVPKKTNSGATRKQIQVVVRAGLEPGTAGL